MKRLKIKRILGFKQDSTLLHSIFDEFTFLSSPQKIPDQQNVESMDDNQVSNENCPQVFICQRETDESKEYKLVEILKSQKNSLALVLVSTPIEADYLCQYLKARALNADSFHGAKFHSRQDFYKRLRQSKSGMTLLLPRSFLHLFKFILFDLVIHYNLVGNAKEFIHVIFIFKKMSI